MGRQSKSTAVDGRPREFESAIGRLEDSVCLAAGPTCAPLRFVFASLLSWGQIVVRRVRKQSLRSLRGIALLSIAFTLLGTISFSPAALAQKGLAGGVPENLLVPKDPNKPKSAQVFRPPPPNTPECKDCIDIYNKLKAAIESFYIQQYTTADTNISNAGDVTPNSTDVGNKIKATSALTQLGSITGREDTAGFDKAKGNDAARKKDKDFPKNTKDLEALINKLAGELKKCEDACKKPKTTDGPKTKVPSVPELPTVGDCLTRNELEKFKADLAELTKQSEGNIGHAKGDKSGDDAWAGWREFAEKLNDLSGQVAKRLQALIDSGKDKEVCDEVPPVPKLKPLPGCSTFDDLQKLFRELREVLKQNDANIGNGNKPGWGAWKEFGAAIKKQLGELNDRMEALNKAKKDKEDCPPPKEKTGGGGSGYYVPGERKSGTFYVSQNGEKVCTYDSGTPYEVAYTPISSGGGVIATYTPGTAGTPQGSTPGTPPSDGTPPAAGTPDHPPQQATPDKQPQQPTDHPPPTTTSDNPPPSTIPDNPPTTDTSQDDEVETYDKETVEKNGHNETGSGLQTQMVMLTTPKPPLMRTDDTPGSGFDRNPAKVRIVDGHGVIRINRAERQAYGLPDTGGQPVHVRLDLTAMKHSSALAEITGKTVKPGLDRALPVGDQVATRTFKVGGKTFMVLDFAQPFNHTEDVIALAARFLGIDLKTDTCDDDKPAAPLFEAPAVAANGNELPSTTIALPRRIHAREAGR